MYSCLITCLQTFVEQFILQQRRLNKVINSTCAFPALLSQNVCCELGLFMCQCENFTVKCHCFKCKRDRTFHSIGVAGEIAVDMQKSQQIKENRYHEG